MVEASVKLTAVGKGRVVLACAPLTFQGKTQLKSGPYYAFRWYPTSLSF